MSDDHLDLIKDYVNKVSAEYETKYGVKYCVNYSTQHVSTDTIAVDLDNNPFRKADGEILFRPGGHGALLANLDNLDADVVFIKNIDNVTKEEYQADTYIYKRALAGYLLEVESVLHNYLTRLKNNDEGAVQEAIAYVKQSFGVVLDQNSSIEDTMNWLNRPIRICGMVKNEGEPGGGPFWVNTRGSVSPQIVESAQIDKEQQDQLSIMNNSTHFNPVDLICGIKDFEGNKFPLRDYRDMETVFISSKSKDGRDLKALELPGLWNGAMADWLTIFVEVPLSTFSPVKTVNDLLKPSHQ